MQYLYIIQNILNGKLYIGQTNDPSRRWTFHKTMSRCNQIQYIHRAMAKHGIKNFVFKVIATCCTQEDADFTETQLIVQYDSRNKKIGYNLAPGGDVAWNKNLPKEQQPMYGKNHSEESKRKISESQKGIAKPKPSEETKRKMSSSHKGLCVGEKSSSAKLDRSKVNEIRKLLSSGQSALSISKKYSVSGRAILNIKSGKSWK